MKLSVKNKIWLGTLFLFLLLSLSGGISIYYMSKLKAESKNILQDNYETLSYCHAMQQDMIHFRDNYKESVQQFDTALSRQEDNITEPGEDKATNNVRSLFSNIKQGDTTSKTIQTIQSELQKIIALNMKAIELKNNKANRTANNALTLILMLAGVVFVISFTFLINFPSVITTPINNLSEAIKEIGNKNYKHRIHINNKDEFGQLADAFNEMATRLEYFENSNMNKLMFEKNRAEAVINSLKDPSIGIDKNSIVLFANYQALQLLGLPSEDLIGKPVQEISVRNDLFRFLMENESSTPFKVVIDNRENYFVKEIIEVEQGEANNKVIVLKNITSYKELDVAKTNFIATISHELKTPLASSDFSLKLLEDERISMLSREQKELIANLKFDNQRMLKILSELLNLSAVEAGRIQLHIQSVSPGTIINSALEAVSVAAKEKDVTIKKLYKDDLPFINADADKTAWVLNNFLTNAIKYSHNNSSVEVNASQQNDMIIFSVKDNGPGIEKEFVPKLFERYFQVPGSKEKGNGLGLAISKEFVEAQQGKVWAESEPGTGSSFYFSLPVHLDENVKSV